MANQLHVAHSKLFSGAGIVAGRMIFIYRFIENNFEKSIL
jgi:hypothetical protein